MMWRNHVENPTGFLVALAGTTLAVSVAAQHTTNASSAGQLWNALAAGNRRFATGKAERRDLVARRKQLVTTRG
jgi:hypothetical protein